MELIPVNSIGYVNPTDTSVSEHRVTCRGSSVLLLPQEGVMTDTGTVKEPTDTVRDLDWKNHVRMKGNRFNK